MSTSKPPIKAIEQYCVKCSKWFKLPTDVVQQLQTDRTSKGLRPFRQCSCTHCKHEQIAVRVGKYDAPNTPKSKCSVQFVTTA